MRSESTTIRPFFGLSNLDAIMAHCSIRFSQEEEFQESSSVKVDIAPYDAHLEIRLPDVLIEAVREWNDLAQWRMAIVLADETRRKSKLLGMFDLNTIIDLKEIGIATANLNLSWVGRKGGTLSLYLALNSNRERVPGLPYRRSQIAGRKHFGLNKSGPGAEFPVEFWSPEQIKEAGFHHDTTVFVAGDAEGLTESAADQVGVKIVINEKLRGAFSHARRLRRANVLQDNIKSQSVAQLLLLAQKLEGLDKESVGFRFTEAVLSKVGKRPGDLKLMNEVEVMSTAQVFCGLTESASKVM